jgi:hypothetical protein
MDEQAVFEKVKAIIIDKLMPIRLRSCPRRASARI